jgi:hypothetical protein
VSKDGSPSYIILDLDNCIADDSRRVPRIDWSQPNPNARYAEYFLGIEDDPIANTDLFHPDALRGAELLILTARPLAYREGTVKWLQRHGVPYRFLLMRNNHDHRSSTAVKRMQVHWLRSLYSVELERVRMAYDDRPEVLRMYDSEFGFNTELRAIHSACAYTNPLTKENHA